MATYFDLSKTSGSGSSTFTVTPKSGYTGRGPVTNTVTVTTKSSPVQTQTISCTKHFPLSRTAEVISTSTSLTGAYTTVTPSSGSIPVANNVATFVKIATTTNAKSITTGGGPSNIYVKVGANWLQADGSLGTTSANVGNKAITITTDPGASATYALEVIYQIPVNASSTQKSYSLSNIYGGTNYPASDADKYTYGLVVTQPAGTITYGDITITEFQYDANTSTSDIDDIPASGGISYPVIAYSQTYGYNGATTGGGTITTGATITYAKNSGSATLNTNNGQVTAASKGTTASARGSVANVTATVSLNGKTKASSAVDCYQTANTAGTTTYSAWTSSVSANPTTIVAKGGTSTISSSCTRVATTPYSSGESTKVTQTATATYSSNQSWLTISGSTATAAENKTESNRTATVSAAFTYNSAAVTPTSGSTSVNIAQNLGTKSYAKPTVSLSYATASAAGGTLTPNLSYTQTWGWNGATTGGGTLSSPISGASVSYSGSTGITVNATTGNVTVASLGTTVKDAATLGTVTVTVTANGQSNTGTANISQAKNEATTITYGEWSNPTVSASPNPIAKNGTSSTISASQSRTRIQNYTSGATSTMSNETNTSSFTVAKKSGDAAFSNTGMTVNVSANTTVSSRSAIFTVTGNSKSSDITITQSAGDSTLSVSPTTLTWDASDTTAKTVTITSNDSWTITIS